jgi:hypothetical protein
VLEGADLERMRAVCDRDEITAVLNRFSRGIDRCDQEVLASCFHPDGFDDHGTIEGSGRDVAAALVAGVRGYWDVTWHSISNIDIDLDGDVAHVETYVMSVNQRQGSQGTLTAVFAGRYVDRFERRDGRWAIAHRTVVHDWSFADRLGPYKGDMSVFVQGMRDRSDVRYRRSSRANASSAT